MIESTAIPLKETTVFCPFFSGQLPTIRSTAELSFIARYTRLKFDTSVIVGLRASVNSSGEIAWDDGVTDFDPNIPKWATDEPNTSPKRRVILQIPPTGPVLWSTASDDKTVIPLCEILQ